MNSILLPLLSSLGPVAILLLMAVAFAETGLLVGFLLPGDSLIFSAGVLVAAHVIALPVWPSIVAVAAAATAGDQVAYIVGRRYGPRVMSRPGSRFLSPRHVEHAHVFFDHHGPRAVFLARFVPLARTLTPVVAGIAHMSRRRFTWYNVAGAASWATVMLGGGYFFGAIPFVAAHVGLIMIGMVVLSLVPAGIGVLRARGTHLQRDPSTPSPGSTTTGDMPCPVESASLLTI